MTVTHITDYLLDQYQAECVKRDRYPQGSPQRSDCEARLEHLARQLEREHKTQQALKPGGKLPPAA